MLIQSAHCCNGRCIIAHKTKWLSSDWAKAKWQSLNNKVIYLFLFMNDWRTSEDLVCERLKVEQSKMRSLFIRVFRTVWFYSVLGDFYTGSFGYGEHIGQRVLILIRRGFCLLSEMEKYI